MPLRLSIVNELPTENFVYTESGLRWLEEHPEFLDVIAAFKEQVHAPELVLKQYDFVGSGTNAIVVDYDGAAVKASTATTAIKSTYAENARPEDLITQFSFLHLLRKYLQSNSDGSVTVPEQYFAYKASGNSYLRAEQRMLGWTTLYDLASKSGWHRDGDEGVVNEMVKRRIVAQKLPQRFRAGLSDLGLRAGQPLCSRNILIPEETSDPNSAPICIIDQPPKGLIGKLVVNAVAILAYPAR